MNHDILSFSRLWASGSLRSPEVYENNAPSGALNEDNGAPLPLIAIPN